MLWNILGCHFELLHKEVCSSSKNKILTSSSKETIRYVGVILLQWTTLNAANG